MKARDVMTTGVVTIGPDAMIAAAVRLMLDHRISGIPVVDHSGHLIGIITEGDLMRRAEISGEQQLRSGASPEAMEAQARAFVKSHGSKVSDVMTARVLSVQEDESVDQIATILEANGIKRVPVTRDGHVIGIVSRANLLRSLAMGGMAANELDDRQIRSGLMNVIGKTIGARASLVDVTMTDGVAYLWGTVASEAERDAIRVLAENDPGIRSVKNHIRLMPVTDLEYSPE
jgi:CBS domain-containing protein